MENDPFSNQCSLTDFENSHKRSDFSGSSQLRSTHAGNNPSAFTNPTVTSKWESYAQNHQYVTQLPSNSITVEKKSYAHKALPLAPIVTLDKVYSKQKTSIRDSEIKKIRKRTSTNFMNQNETISLRVDPTKMTNSQDLVKLIKPPSTRAQGQLHPELSVRPTLKCAQCGKKDTPEWRRGPDGARTLCNACGLFHSKLTKKMGKEKAILHLLKLRKEGLKTNRRIPET